MSPREGEISQSNPPLIPGLASAWRWQLQSLGAWVPLLADPGFPWQAQGCSRTLTLGAWPSPQKAGLLGPLAPHRQHVSRKRIPHR